MNNIFPFNKFITGLNIIKANGGAVNAFKKLFRFVIQFIKIKLLSFFYELFKYKTFY